MRLVVAVTYDPAVGYRTTGGPEVPAVNALSLAGLRRRIEIALLPDDVRVVLQLDVRARRERDQRRRGGASRPTDYARPRRCTAAIGDMEAERDRRKPERRWILHRGPVETSLRALG
jgi:hypothetical protein